MKRTMQYDGTNLNEVLEAHKKWINEDDNGERANFSGEDLSEVDLSGAYLRGADLSGANFSEADLSEADLSGANLNEVDLSNANLSNANLSEADLIGAWLIEAVVIGADLSGADLSEADLSRACLEDTDLRRADLSGACLENTDLKGADLRGAWFIEADLRGAKNTPFIPMACPDSGSFVGWKKCIAHGENDKPLIVKLMIPEDAKRSSATGRKCRCDKAVVLEIQNLDGSKSEFDTAYSIYEIYSVHENNYKPLAYKLGEMVVSENGFCEDRFIECAEGIHFFINRQEAVDY